MSAVLKQYLIDNQSNSGGSGGGGNSGGYNTKNTVSTPGTTQLPNSNKTPEPVLPKSNQPTSTFNVGDRVKTKESGFMAAAHAYTWTGSEFKQNGTKYVNLAGPAIDYFTIGNKKYWDGKW